MHCGQSSTPLSFQSEIPPLTKGVADISCAEALAEVERPRGDLLGLTGTCSATQVMRSLHDVVHELGVEYVYVYGESATLSSSAPHRRFTAGIAETGGGRWQVQACELGKSLVEQRRCEGRRSCEDDFPDTKAC